ncbi:MAG: glycosyltransferase family 61 protein [Candidatus Adiutrix intracellularis]|nr:glycosyltransferase family 61 protein [Candidatus Adiutrix intracellularis]
MNIFISLVEIYRKYFSQFFLFRLLREIVVLGYRFLYRSLIILKNKRKIKKLLLKSIDDIIKILQIHFTNINDGELISISSPKCFKDGQLSFNSTAKLDIEISPIKILELYGAVAISGTDFTIYDNFAVHHNLFTLDNGSCKAELIGLCKINRQKKLIYFYLNNKILNIDEGIVFFGQNTKNYAHWLVETLPKLAILNKCNKYRKLPIIVEDDLHKNMYESIEVLNHTGHEIIKIKRWTQVNLKKAVLLSNSGFEPYMPQDLFNRINYQYQNQFSYYAFNTLRQALWALVPKVAVLKPNIYLARDRKSINLRNIINFMDVESFFHSCDFYQVSPGDLNFLDQVILSKNARFIAGPIGAGLVNMIFAKPGCKILAMSPDNEVANYNFYNNLASVLGHELYFVLGRTFNKKIHPVHRNYKILIDDLKTVLGLLNFDNFSN